MAGAACGDVNKNGSVDVADALSLAGVIAAAGDCGVSKPDCDVLKDNTIDIQDLTNLVAKLAGLKTLFDSCTGPGPVVSCTDGADPDTGKPLHKIAAGSITTNQTWPDTCTIELNGIVFVDTLVGQLTTVVTVKPGTVVKGKGSGTVNPAVLIFLPGSKIDAQGTPQKPIIFTSGQPVGSRGPGDWGGVLLNGKSTVNRPNCVNTAEGIPAAYGGCDASDSSGVMTYTRVEFSGIEFTPNNELNILTLNGVGNQTLMHHIQANQGGDDCIEWFGGTVNLKYFVSSGCADDGFDYQLGTTGSRQYGLQVQYGPILQTGKQSRGIEADNSEFGFDDLPRSNPKFCNLTMIGSRDNDPNIGSEAGLFFRRGTAGTVANAIVANYGLSCIRSADNTTTNFACTAGPALKTTDPFLLVENTLCYNNGDGTTTQNSMMQATAGACTATQVYNLWNTTKSVFPAAGGGTIAPNIPTTFATVTAGYPATLPNLIPSATTGFPPATDCHVISDFFDTTNYIGAFDPAGGPGANWLDTGFGTGSFDRWISFDVN